MTTPDMGAGVHITLGQMYGELKEAARVILRTEAKVDALAEDVAGEREEQRTIRQDHETRIRALEARRWPLAPIGALAAVGGAIGGAVAVFAR